MDYCLQWYKGKVFSYGVHYHINEDTKTITILGVFHVSLGPDKWQNRL